MKASPLKWDKSRYFQTTARPSIFNLSSRQTVTIDLEPFYGSDFDKVFLLVNEGNPNLKPAITHNFDISVEYYHDQIGVIRLSGYYKTITNSLQSTGVDNILDINTIDFPDHRFINDPQYGLLALIADDGAIVEASRVTNSNNPSKIWGFEAHIERQFTFLPGFWNGFGMYANFTYTDSKTEQLYIWRDAPLLDDDGNVQPAEFDPGCFFCGPPEGIQRGIDVLSIPNQQFNLSPKTSGTVALTYNKHNIDATLAYGFQARHQQLFTPNNLNSYSEGVGTLDFRASYYFEVGAGQFRVFVEGQDLLKGTNSPDLESSVGGIDGIPKYYTGATYLGGRKIRVGLSATF